MNNWKEERQKVFRRAEALLTMVKSTKVISGAEILDEANTWANEDPENRSIMRRVACLLFKELGALTTGLEVKLIYGTVSYQEHAWFVVEGNPMEVNAHEGDVSSAGLEDIPPGRMNARGVWRYIVDPMALEVIPQTLLISPVSPFMNLYIERERFTEIPADPPMSPLLMETIRARENSLEKLRAAGIIE